MIPRKDPISSILPYHRNTERPEEIGFGARFSFFFSRGRARVDRASSGVCCEPQPNPDPNERRTKPYPNPVFSHFFIVVLKYRILANSCQLLLTKQITYI